MLISRHVRETMAPPLTALTARAAERRAAGRDLYVLAQAMVDYAPPPVFLRAIVEGVRAEGTPVHRYTPDPGLPRLRAALGVYLARAFGIDCDPERELLVTPGANQASYEALSVLLAPGDEALLLSPWYFNHEMTVRLLGGRVRAVEARPNAGFVPSVAEIRDAWTPRLRVLALVNPSNPTGARYPDAWVRELGAALAADRRWDDVWILSDQTYQELFYSGRQPLSPAALPALSGRTVTVGSFSKSLALAGWRLGFLAAPAALVNEILKVHDSSVICAAHAAQYALARTLEARDEVEDYCAQQRLRLARRRDALLAPLRANGRFEIATPDGACFAFVGLPAAVASGEQFATQLLEGHDVVAVPGAPFGPAWDRYLRLSFGVGSPARLAAAGERIATALDHALT